MAERIALDALNGMDEDAFVRALYGVFEDAPWVARRAAAGRPYLSVAALHEGLVAAVADAPVAEQEAFVAGHPDLAGKAARAGAIAAASVEEQAGLGLDRLDDADFARFEDLNGRYRARFGLPFVICVARHTRDGVLAAFERRLANDRAAEFATALAEIGHITRLRLVARVDGPGAPRVAGTLSTHVLDTWRGRSAAGVPVELFEVGRSERARLAAAVTNADGRTERPLLSGAPLRIGRYALHFHLGAYFGERAAMPFLDVVVVEFGIGEAEGHIHVPLVVTPWSYTVYRGS